MGRANDALNKISADAANVVDISGELERMDGRPENIPQHVWDMIRENGELATTRLNEILSSPRFARLKASDQAKLIGLAQTRAYGAPVANRVESGNKRRGGARDVVQSELDNLAYRSSLPEYKGINLESDTNGNSGQSD
ncbi:MAG: hypothetical protein GKR86_01040 [Ilumatobacter sp.]|nr:hypothetical protein [Ilumatobacter sp.]